MFARCARVSEIYGGLVLVFLFFPEQPSRTRSGSCSFRRAPRYFVTKLRASEKEEKGRKERRLDAARSGTKCVADPVERETTTK